MKNIFSEKCFYVIFFGFIVYFLMFSVTAKGDYRSDLSNLEPSDKAWIEKACEYTKSNGPSYYISCIRREISALTADSRLETKVKPAPQTSSVASEPIDPKTKGLYDDALASLENNEAIINQQQVDLNIDTATITSQKANLRDAPNINGSVIGLILNGKVVALIDREATDGWFNVIDIETSREGWLHQSTLKIILSKNPKQEQLFQAETLPYFSEPEIAIQNASNLNINLKVGTQLILIPANSSKSLKITQGTYKYYASAPSVLPSLGTQIFDNSHRYSWKFWVETSYGVKGRRGRR